MLIDIQITEAFPSIPENSTSFLKINELERDTK